MMADITYEETGGSSTNITSTPNVGKDTTGTSQAETMSQGQGAEDTSYDASSESADDRRINNVSASEYDAQNDDETQSVLPGSMSDSYDALSYDSILVNYRAFRQAGGKQSSPFNTWDFPGHNFFRILFHFEEDTGLLSPAWIGMKLPSQSELEEGTTDLVYWNKSCAWTYLMQNAEYVRANYMKQFIELLSNINTESPWYFQSIKGLNDALNRKQVNDAFDFKERAKITIECLEDSQDQRIGTLLDLYRAAVWSWRTKRMIVPANLRKFDMTVVIISSPVHNLHTPVGDLVPNQINDVIGATSPTAQDFGVDYASASPTSGPNKHRASYKVIELHNCEIDYNSSIGGYENVDNKEGFTPKYNIDILFDDAVEIRYNEFLEGFNEITDLIGTDVAEPIYTDSTSTVIIENTPETVQSSSPGESTTPPSTTNDTASRTRPSNIADKKNKSIIDKLKSKIANPLNTIKKNSKGFLPSVVDELEEYGASWVSSKVNKVLLGNLFGLSITKVARQIGQALNGQVLATAYNIENAKRPAYNGAEKTTPLHQNIFEDNIPPVEAVLPLGNIFRGKTLAQS